MDIPAFPVKVKKNTSTDPLATPREVQMQGMTLRDYFAAAALPYALKRDYGNDWGKDGKQHVPYAVGHAYAIADAMIAKREKRDA